MTDLLTPITWAITALKADSTLADLVGTRIYTDEYPQDTSLAYPYVILTKIPGEPVKNNEARVIFWNDLLQVSVYDQGASYVRAGAVLTQVMMVLDRAAGSTANGTVIGCVVEMEIPPQTINEDGVKVKSLGVEFRVYSQ